MLSHFLLACLLWINSVPPENGSLLFLEHSSRIVERKTNSPHTHVAMILCEDGVPYVYEAVRDEGVHRVPLIEYLDEEKANVRIAFPARPFTSEEIESLQHYLNSQLGRRYSIRSYLKEEAVRGVHCSELIAQALLKIGILIEENCATVTPADIIDSVIEDEYGELTSLQL